MNDSARGILLGCRTVVLTVLIGSLLGGCVISVHDDDGWGDDGDGWRARQRRNAAAIEHLELGRSLTSVTDELGKADMTESFVREGRPYQVLMYRTRHMHSDGRVTRDETTPLVFVDGELVGWGESAIANALP